MNGITIHLIFNFLIMIIEGIIANKLINPVIVISSTKICLLHIDSPIKKSIIEVNNSTACMLEVVANIIPNFF